MEEIRKKCNGQSGDDANVFVRNKRIEVRVSPREWELLIKYAKLSGFNSCAQYLRESGIQDSAHTHAIPIRKALQTAQYELNRIGNNVNQIAKHLNSGNPLDDETRMVLSQIQECAEQLIQEAQSRKYTRSLD